LRLRISPAEALVYVDGALAGTVDDFNGLTNHLELAAGEHTIEVRAAGYDTLVLTVDVEEGKTITQRGELERLVR
jgi:hypothetical protein